jgi:site-specific DNA-methyltransferase (adenine-specific)
MGNTYQKDGIVLINGDSLAIMDNLIAQGVQVDCIATDPPYKTTARGHAGNSGGMLQKEINKKGQVFDHNSCDVKNWMPKLYQLLKEGGHCYIMTNHKNLVEYLNVALENGFSFIKSLIWDKQNKIMGQFYMSQYEYILFFRKGRGIKINNCGTSDILSIPNKKHKDSNGQNYHDTEKPVELMKILIENSTKENEIVLEPFMGIGATAVAAKELNRKCIACEIDENYYNIALDRINGNEFGISRDN